MMKKFKARVKVETYFDVVYDAENIEDAKDIYDKCYSQIVDTVVFEKDIDVYRMDLDSPIKEYNEYEKDAFEMEYDSKEDYYNEED